ncbi:MAG: hypothetical protein DCF16_07405 [Alphaproteobacteria bacterium]|nr:MAG: hypothetical protein DCF16_07405 [Alphaproteobacteria bacterium]
MTWQAFLVSFVVGAGVGVFYGLLNVRSPAPPIVALLGLLGMVIGEGVVSYVRGHRDVVEQIAHAKSFSHAPRDGSRDQL